MADTPIRTPSARKLGTQRSRIAAADKRRRVLALYAGGTPIQVIAEENDWKVQSVKAIIAKSIKAYRDDTTRSVEAVRATQLQRLDLLLEAVWPVATRAPDEQGEGGPSMAAVREVLRIEQLRSRIAGTERAPDGPAAGGDVHLHIGDPERIKQLTESFMASNADVYEGTATEIPRPALPAAPHPVRVRSDHEE